MEIDDWVLGMYLFFTMVERSDQDDDKKPKNQCKLIWEVNN